MNLSHNQNLVSYTIETICLIINFFLVNQSNILTYDSRLQRFSGGVQTVCQSKFEETCETNCQDKPNYHQLPCKPKCKTHFAGFSLDSFQCKKNTKTIKNRSFLASASSITTGTGSTTRSMSAYRIYIVFDC